ncbi:hypothetical protein BC830DRAFT_215484 [Chytriomyces sp. MP71]|nr:hypothetical protein BC830DRAFT_215484 [Chytriomyces sp. MP71]
MDRISLETLHQTALLNSRNFNETQGRPLNPLRRDNEKVQTVWVFDPKKTTSCSGIPIAIFRREYNGNGDNCDAGSPNTCRISRNAMFQCGYGQGWDYADYFDQRSINTRARWIVNLNDYSCPQTGLFGATSAIASGTCVQNSQGSVLIACDSIYIYTSQCRDGGCSSQCTTYVAQQNVCSPIGYQACIVASNGPSWPFTSIDVKIFLMK